MNSETYTKFLVFSKLEKESVLFTTQAKAAFYNRTGSHMIASGMVHRVKYECTYSLETSDF